MISFTSSFIISLFSLIIGKPLCNNLSRRISLVTSGSTVGVSTSSLIFNVGILSSFSGMVSMLVVILEFGVLRL